MGKDQFWREAVDWLCKVGAIDKSECLLSPKAEPRDLAVLLRDGTVLCALASKLYPNAIFGKKVYSETRMSQFYCTSNIKLFLDACKNVFGIRPEHLFEPEELYNCTDFSKVLKVLSRLSQSELCKRHSFPSFPTNWELNGGFVNDNDEAENYRSLKEAVVNDFAQNEEIYDSRIGMMSNRAKEMDKIRDDKIYDSLVNHNFPVIYESSMDKYSMFVPKFPIEHALKELFDTEQRYNITVLQGIVNNYYTPMKKDLSEEDHRLIFLNIIEIQRLHQQLLPALKKLVLYQLGIEKPKEAAISVDAIFEQFREKFTPYGKYCANLNNARDRFLKLQTGSSELRKRLREYDRLMNEGKFGLLDYIIIPFQRILKYSLLLEQILKQIPISDHTLRSSYERAVEMMNDISNYINEHMRDNEFKEGIETIRQSILDMELPGKTTLLDFGRRHIDGEIKVADYKDGLKLKNRYVFIFDKLMIVCKAQRNNTFVYKTCYLLSNYQITDELETNTLMNTLSRTFTSTTMGSFYLIDNSLHNKTLSKTGSLDGTTSCESALANTIQLSCKNLNQKRMWMEKIKLAQETVNPTKAKQNGHRVDYQTFEQATSCSFCNKFLHGMYYQGYYCHNCCQNFHKHCLENTRKCTGRRANFHNDNARNLPRRITFCGVLGEIWIATTAETSRDPEFLNFKPNDLIEITDIKSDGRMLQGRLVDAPNKIGLVCPQNIRKSTNNPNHITRAVSMQTRIDPPAFNNNSNNNTLTRRSTNSINNCRVSPSDVLPNEGILFAKEHNDYILQNWFVGTIDRQMAEAKLVNMMEGAFLVRYSHKERVYVISLKTKPRVKHMKVENVNNQFYLATTKTFPKLVDLIDFYGINSLSECFEELPEIYLRMPVLRSKLYRVKQNFDKSVFPPDQFSDNRIMSLSVGETVILLDLIGEEKHWWLGKVGETIGFFPIQYVREIIDEDFSGVSLRNHQDDSGYSRTSSEQNIDITGLINETTSMLSITVFELPSLILLLLTQFILIQPSRKEKFSSSFYSLLFWNGIIDIIAYVAFTLHHRFPNYAIFVDIYYSLYINETDIRFFEFLRSASNMGQLMGTFFLSINRLTSITIPTKHERVWKKLLPISLVLTMTFAVGLTCPILFDKMVFIPHNSSNIDVGFRGKWMTGNAGWYNAFLVMMCMSLICLLSCLLANLCTLVLLIKMVLRSQSTTISRPGPSTMSNFKRERNLFLTAFVAFFGQLLLALDNYISGHFNQTKQYDNFYIMVMIFPIVNSLTIFPCTWLLLYASVPIRDALFTTIGLTKYFSKSKTRIITVTSNK
uniref:Protein vav n=1 Tax=Rhabditophanes sp. KR3021 TaxID=114890 RepID=A0AC35TP81_9BILA